MGLLGCCSFEKAESAPSSAAQAASVSRSESGSAPKSIPTKVTIVRAPYSAAGAAAAAAAGLGASPKAQQIELGPFSEKINGASHDMSDIFDSKSIFDSLQGVPVAGPFGVMRQPTANSMLQEKLRRDIASCDRELAKAHHEELQRRYLMVLLEREAFEKDQDFKCLCKQVGMQINSSTAECKRLRNELIAREAETSNWQKRLEGLTDTVQEMKAELTAKSETALQLVFQLSCMAQRQNVTSPSGQGTISSPLLQSQPSVSKSIEVQ